jgi:hypothetical protein
MRFRADTRPKAGNEAIRAVAIQIAWIWQLAGSLLCGLDARAPHDDDRWFELTRLPS